MIVNRVKYLNADDDGPEYCELTAFYDPNGFIAVGGTSSRFTRLNEEQRRHFAAFLLNGLDRKKPSLIVEES